MAVPRVAHGGSDAQAGVFRRKVLGKWVLCKGGGIHWAVLCLSQ